MGCIPRNSLLSPDVSLYSLLATRQLQNPNCTQNPFRFVLEEIIEQSRKDKTKKMRSSQGGIFIKLITNWKLHQSHPILISSALLRRFCSIRDFNTKNCDNDNRNYQNPPEPIPDRPLRGERPFTNQNQNRCSFQPRFNNYQQQQRPQQQSFQSPNRPRPKSPDGVQSDENFLDQFKLAIDKKPDNPQQNESLGQRQEQKPNRNEPLSEPPQEADEIFKKMKETGLIPNAVAMLDGLCKDGLIQEAMKLFGLMREKGTIPEVVIYTAVVDGFCKAQKFDDAKRIFRKMQSNGIAPNAFSYNLLIQGLYKCNKLEEAVEYCIEMLEAGHSPNVTTFVGLVDGLCREKGVEKAQSVIATLKEKGFLVNDKAVREFLDKKAPFSSSVWEAIFGKKTSQKPF